DESGVRSASPPLVSPARRARTRPPCPPATLSRSDSAVLAGGYFPTGNIVFTLPGPGGFLYPQTAPVSGNGAYTASTTLPTTGTVAGTYTWSLAYPSDHNNNPPMDQDSTAQHTAVT